MTRFEFVFLVAWVLLLPLLPAAIVLVAMHRHNRGRTVRRTVEAGIVLVSLSACIAVALTVFGPAQLGPYIGVRDTPVTWAPFAFIAVALALPVAIWWASRVARS